MRCVEKQEESKGIRESEYRIVGYDHACLLCLTDEEVFEPGNILDVEMVRGLVKEEDVSVLEDGAA